MSQEYLPSRIGLASGLSIGFSIGLGGIAALALGAVADAVDLETAMYACAAVPAARDRRSASLLPSSRAPAAVSRRSRHVGSPVPRPRRAQWPMTAREFFEGLEGRIDPAKTAGMTNSYVFEIEGAGTWKVDVQDGSVSVTEGDGDADATISASEETFEQIASGDLNATTAYMTGKLKVKGDMGAAMKLQKLF